MKTPRKPTLKAEEAPVISFTRVIEVAPKVTSFSGWGPSRWN
jgi:hypothetical protein